MNPKYINLRAGPIEFRWSEGNQKYELLQWYPWQEGGEHCCVIAFLDRTKEGFDMRTVGHRYHDALAAWPEEVMAVTSYDFDLLQARFKAEELIEQIKQ